MGKKARRAAETAVAAAASPVAAGIRAETPGFAPIGGGSGPGLEAGAIGRRLSTFRPASAHINTLIGQAGNTVLRRARWLARNNGYAINAADWWANRVIGASGISPSWTDLPATRKKALRQAWDDWTDEADAEGLTDLYGLQRRAAREMFIAGEVFFRLRYRLPGDGLTVPLQLQMLPSEMLDPNDNRRLPSGNTVRQGIEFDRIGRRVAYHFFREHPSDSTEQRQTAGEKTRVPAEEVMHLLDPVEAGQLRGLSRFSNVIVKLFVLDQYDDAELERKKTAALNVGFYEASDDMDEGPYTGPPQIPDGAGTLATTPDDTLTVPMEPGTVTMLPPGGKMVFNNPADVGGNYDAFQYRNLLQAASGLGVPYFALTGDVAKGNWSSQRTALVDAKARVEAFQHAVVVYGLCRRVAQVWLEQAVLAGAVRGLKADIYLRDRAKYRRIRWMTPAWQWVDPVKEVQAEIMAMNALLKAPDDVMEASGYDAEETDRRTAAAMLRRRKLGIALIGLGAVPSTEPDQDKDDVDTDAGDNDQQTKQSEE